MFCICAEKDIIELDIGVDEAFKMVISTGIVNPEKVKKGKKLTIK